MSKKISKKVSPPKSFRLLDFHIYDENPKENGKSSSDISSSSSSDEEKRTKNKILKDENVLKIQMFGINEMGETCSLFITNYKPFFYIKVGDDWTQETVNLLLGDIRRKVGTYHDTSILSGKLVEYHKLYGFTGGKKDKFVEIVFKNMATMNRVKNLWYKYTPVDQIHPEKGTEKHKCEYIYPPFHSKLNEFNITKSIQLELYESNIPPLLRYFHIHNISPSGWISIPNNKIFKPHTTTTTCKYEYICRIEDVTPLPLKEERVPYKICSFDIEASSSHGDFPIPKKTYKKLATNMVDSFEEYFKLIFSSNNKNNNENKINEQEKKNIIKRIKNIILTAFGYKPTIEKIDIVYPKRKISKEELLPIIDTLLEKPIRKVEMENCNDENRDLLTIDQMFDKMREKNTISNETEIDVETGCDEDNCNDDNDEEENTNEGDINLDVEDADDVNSKHFNKNKNNHNKLFCQKIDKQTTIYDVIVQSTYKRDEKIQIINEILTLLFPSLEGDKTTFIGSTFLKYGEPEPYLNHCFVLGSCEQVEGAVIETVNTERELLTKWTQLIQSENPDIIIGYNIFGFDYEFMFRRAEENHCEREFLNFSRRISELSAKQDKNTGKFSIENSKIVLASGEYDLRFYKTIGRLQIDMLYYLRRDFNLASYKLDDVAGLYISDDIKNVICDETKQTTEIHTQNITGLHVNDYIHIEMCGFTTDYFKDGKKYQIIDIVHKEHTDNQFNHLILKGYEPELISMKNIKWCVAKDDVSPQDIFRLSNGSSSDRAIVAKYCIQDCNLVHHLMNKIDVITGYVEMASICSVPISFLVFRGQGIKLTSYVAKKCREKNTLMPDLEKTNANEGYEGAIVLPPKCGIYTDNPVACVDYSSLYPSSMISQNLSHDSKVWTKEYDLEGNLIRTTGDKTYDNLPGFHYIDIEFDTYKYLRNPEKPNAKAEKTKVGKMVCRWAQFPNNKKGIMPSILEELLKARSTTRKMIKTEKDPFMQNILDKRQLGYKVTANSLYGQCGSRTSTFYEKDIAASTTATGRMMIIYAKNIIENVYGDRIYQTQSHGLVHTRAEYVYGDSVAGYTPVFVRINNTTLRIYTIEQLVDKYISWCNCQTKKWQMCKEPGKQNKEYFEFDKLPLETWTENGWTPLKRIIRHELAPHKKMIRVITKNGLVDVTDDHSLIHSVTKTKIRPNECDIGTPLLHHYPPTQSTYYIGSVHYDETNSFHKCEARIMGYFYGSGDCCNYLFCFIKRRYWLLENLSSKNKIIYLSLCKHVYPEYTWVTEFVSNDKYIIYPKYKKNYELGATLKSLVKKYNMNMYENNCKIIPKEILTANDETRNEFWRGFMDSQSFCENVDNETKTITIKENNQLSASYICAFVSSIGYDICSINVDNSPNSKIFNKDIYCITICQKNRENLNSSTCNIIKMSPIESYEGYVYDLTTENHHFAAGIGNMIVHNTDSVFFTFNLENTETKEKIRGKDALEITIEIAQDAAHLCSKWLKPPMELSYEKTLMPFILLSKKRYVGMLYETNPEKGKMKYMGLSIKRRDSCDYLKDVYGGILNILMKEHNLSKSIEFLDKSLKRLIDGDVPMDKLMISKSLRSDYKNPNQIAHKVLAERIAQREPGNKPKPGDRIKFVHVVNKNKKALQGEKIETPEFIISNQIPVDYSFYITNQLMKPIQQLFGLAIEQILELRGNSTQTLKKELKDLEKTYGNDLEVFAKKKEKLCSLRVKKILFDKYLTQISNQNNGIKFDILHYYGGIDSLKNTI